MLEELFIKDKNYEIIKCEEKGEKINIFVKSKIESCSCPKCNQLSAEYHGTYTRKIQDVSIHNTETWLNVTSYEFECNNKECSTTTFTEELPFARKNKVKTDALIQLILSISIFLSSSSASLVLSFIGIKVSADTIDDIIQKIDIKDNPDVEAIGIDDVAKRKGQTYATAIYDLKDHHLLALIDGRDAESVKEWLRGHKKIKIAARDRASSYATAISEILPECIQVADRFHLFENLITYLKDIFYKEVPEKIFIKDGEVTNPKNVTKVAIEQSVDKSKLEKFEYNNSQPIDSNGNPTIFDNKRRNLDSKQYQNQTQNRLEKQKMIKMLREDLKNSNCHDTQRLAKKYGISTASLRKYRNMTDEEVEQLSERTEYKKRKTIMDDYINIIYKMIVDKIPPEYVIAYVVQKGYSGKISNIKDYIVNIVNNNNLSYDYSSLIYIKMVYPSNIKVITRYELLKYLLTIDSKKINSDIAKYVDIIARKYPIVNYVKDVFKSFHDTIFSGNPDMLDTFISNYQELIPSFCNGLKKDIAPVKNAISYKINSGFVEGNNNKFKLIKRIVYGKQKIVNLFKKSYLSFLATTDDFNIQNIVEGVLQNDK